MYCMLSLNDTKVPCLEQVFAPTARLLHYTVPRSFHSSLIEPATRRDVLRHEDMRWGDIDAPSILLLPDGDGMAEGAPLCHHYVGLSCFVLIGTPFRPILGRQSVTSTEPATAERRCWSWRIWSSFRHAVRLAGEAVMPNAFSRDTSVIRRWMTAVIPTALPGLSD
jgi:hypothetical protein